MGEMDGPFKNVATSTYLILIKIMQAIGQSSGLKVNIFLVSLSRRTTLPKTMQTTGYLVKGCILGGEDEARRGVL